MKTLLLAAGAAALALSASSALAHTPKHSGKAVAGPKEPIPYAELDSYLKASPHMRASKDWWSGQTASAATSSSSSANASATAPAGSESSTTPPSSTDTTSPPTSPSASQPSTSSTTPPK